MKRIDTTGRRFIHALTGELPTGKLVWVDQVNGNDAAGLRGRMERPFATLTAAKTAAFDGDTITVLPGVYNEGDLADPPSDVNWFFMNGAIVNYTGTAVAIFNVNGFVNFTVAGSGIFTLPAGSNSRILNLTSNAAGSSIQFQAAEMRSGANACIGIADGAVPIHIANSITSIGPDAVRIVGGSTVLRTEIIQGRLYMSGGFSTVNVERIDSQYAATQAVHLTSGTLKVGAFEVLSRDSYGVEFAGGALTVANARIVSQLVHANARAVYLPSGATALPPVVRLVRCALIVDGTATYAIGGAAGSQVGYYGGIISNKTGHTNVANVFGSPYTQNQYVS